MSFTESLAIAMFEAVKREELDSSEAPLRWIDVHPEIRARTFRVIHAMLAEAKVAVTAEMLRAGESVTVTPADGHWEQDIGEYAAKEVFTRMMDAALGEKP